jgi:hypothetical protein
MANCHSGGRGGAYRPGRPRQPTGSPTLQAIRDQTIGSNQSSITVALQGSDPDGDTLTYSAQADSLEHQRRLNLGL